MMHSLFAGLAAFFCLGIAVPVRAEIRDRNGTTGMEKVYDDFLCPVWNYCLPTGNPVRPGKEGFRSFGTEATRGPTYNLEALHARALDLLAAGGFESELREAGFEGPEIDLIIRDIQEFPRFRTAPSNSWQKWIEGQLPQD